MRFIQPDTVIPNQYNPLDYDRYGYSRNNPINYTDPSGHFPWPIILLLGAVIAGGVGIPVALDIATVEPITERSAPAPTSNDMTGWLTDRLNENANSPVTQALNENMTSGDPINVAGATKAWTALVRTGATWDYKTDINKAGIKDANDNIVLCGETLNYQAIANIHYAAIGRAAGIPQWVLESGAGHSN